MRLRSDIDLEPALRRALESSIGLPCRVESASGDPQAMIDGDFLPLPRGMASELRIWSNSRCIVASRSQATRREFSAACAVSERAGWPVATRGSGGSAVVHRPGILNVSIRRRLPLDSQRWMTRGYETFLGHLISALELFAVDCDAGEVPGAYCDGRFNLRIGDRKLAGTAAHSGVRDGSRICLFHASIVLSGSIRDDIAAIERFEAALGSVQRYEPAAHVSLAQLLAPAAVGNYEENLSHAVA